MGCTEQQVGEFLERLKTRSHDRYYQTIELPYGKTIKGYERTENTWDVLSKLVDFGGKTVLDAGCYHGYCAFKMEAAGAIVTGIDRTKDAIDTVEELKLMLGYKVELIHADLDDWVPSGNYDVVLCSNVIHHPKDSEGVVKKLFSVGDLVIFEAHEEFKKYFDRQETHELLRQVDTERTPDLNRRLYFYQRKQ